MSLCYTGRELVLIADVANHYVWSLAHPDWEVRFDVDKAAAAATRRKVLGIWQPINIVYRLPYAVARAGLC